MCSLVSNDELVDLADIYFDTFGNKTNINNTTDNYMYSSSADSLQGGFRNDNNNMKNKEPPLLICNVLVVSTTDGSMGTMVIVTVKPLYICLTFYTHTPSICIKREREKSPHISIHIRHYEGPILRGI